MTSAVGSDGQTVYETTVQQHVDRRAALKEVESGATNSMILTNAISPGGLSIVANIRRCGQKNGVDEDQNENREGKPACFCHCSEATEGRNGK